MVAPVSVFWIGNSLCDTRRSSPPGNCMGSDAPKRYLWGDWLACELACRKGCCIAGGTRPGRIYASLFGNLVKTDSGNPRFRESTFGGVWPNPFVIEKGSNLLKMPSSKPRVKLASFGPKAFRALT